MYGKHMLGGIIDQKHSPAHTYIEMLDLMWDLS